MTTTMHENQSTYDDVDRTTYWVVEDWRNGKWNRHPESHTDRKVAVRAALRCVRDLHERKYQWFGVRVLKLKQEQSWSYEYDRFGGDGHE